MCYCFWIGNVLCVCFHIGLITLAYAASCTTDLRLPLKEGAQQSSTDLLLCAIILYSRAILIGIEDNYDKTNI